MTTTNHHYYNNKYTTQLLMYVLFFILGFILGCNMGCGKTGKTEIKVIKVQDSSAKKPEPIHIEVIEPGRIPEMASSKPYIVRLTDTLWIYENNIVDTNAILQDYFAKVIYKDTLKTKYGNITVWDTITRNRIEGRKFLADLNIPSEIIYVNNPAPKKRNEVYFSMGGLYNTNALSVGPGLLLKTKRDRMFGVNAYLGTDGMITYNFQTAFKISLRRK
jgi:hypothetical protein